MVETGVPPLFGPAHDPPARAAEFRRSLAVVIGINDYANGIPRLVTAANDARRVATILRDDFGYDVHLIAEGATRARLAALFADQLPAEVGEDDRLLIYFAGHGIALDGEDGPEGFLIPQDAQPEDKSTFLPMTAVHAGLITLKCRHMLAILDCCFAGAFRWSSTRNLQLVLPPILHKERYDRYIRDPAWQVLTSAAYDQSALDILAGDVVGKRGAIDSADGQHSPFALALFAALSGAADLVPRGKGDGVITATELYLFLRDYVEVAAAEQAGHYQTPGIWPLRRQDKGEFIFLTPGHDLDLPPAPELTATNNPYRGLEAYDEKHADLLFGRTELIEQLAARVERQPLTVVLGASGTGKSSLVKAGLAPHLRHLADAHSEWYLLPPMRPGDTPVHVLADLLTNTLDEGAVVDASVQAIAQRADDWLAAHPGTRLLLIVDQCEELITLCRDDAERERFLGLLANLAGHASARMRIVLTLRTDFEPQFLDSPLSPDWQDSRFVVTPLTQAELREVIEKPAAARVLFFDPPELVDDLIDEVIQTPGALPLLSFTLSELYLKYLKRQDQAQRDGVPIERSLTAEDYRALGGVIGSLRTRANEVYAALDAAEQVTMRRIMLRMVAVEGGELARRRVLWSELEYQDKEENRRVETIVDRLVAARLLVRGSADLDSNNTLDAYVEPAHDALVRGWDKLLLWRQQAQEYLPLQRRLTRAAQEWENAGVADRPGLLWNNDPGLPQVLPDIIRLGGAVGMLSNPLRALWPSTQMAKAPVWLNKQETAFVQASLQRRARIRRRIVAITTGVMIVITATAIVAIIQRNIAQRQAEVNKSIALASGAQRAIQNNDYDLAIPLALAANAIPDPPQLAGSALAAAAYVPGTRLYLDLHSADVTGVAFSPDGKDALSGSLDKRAEIWDAVTGQIVHRLDETQITGVTGVAYSPTGDRAVLGQTDGSVVVWDTQSGELIRSLTGLTQSVSALAFGPDGRTVLAGNTAGALILWDPETGTRLGSLPGHARKISAVAVGPDGHTALSGAQDGSLTLWDLANDQPIRSFEGGNRSVMMVSYGPGTGYIMSGSTDQMVRVWDVDTGELAGRFPLSRHTQAISSIAAAPDDATVVSGAMDGSMILWDKAPIGAFIRAFVGHRAPVISLAYSSDGRHVLSGSRDGVVRLWDIGGPTQIHRFGIEPPLVDRPGIDPLHNLAIDEEGRRALSGTARALILWNLDTGEVIRRLPAPADSLSSVAISPDGKTALSADSGDLSQWHLETGKELRRLPGNASEVLTIAYRPDGHTALTGAQNGAVIEWDLDTGQIITQHVLPQADIWSVAFSPDSKFALTGAEDRSMILWDTATGAEIRRFEGHRDAVYWVAISPDGTTALSGSADRQIILWDLATGQPIRYFQGHSLPIHTVAYSPDGRTIVSGSEDKTIRLWDIKTGAEIFRFEGHSSTVQNVLYLRNEPRILSRGSDGSLILWQFPPAKADLQHLDINSLVEWTKANRYVRDLTCDERRQYNVEPLCAAQ